MRPIFLATLVAVMIAASSCSHEPTIADEFYNQDLEGLQSSSAAPVQEPVVSEAMSAPAEYPAYTAPAPKKRLARAKAKAKSRKKNKRLAKARARKNKRGGIARR